MNTTRHHQIVSNTVTIMEHQTAIRNIGGKVMRPPVTPLAMGTIGAVSMPMAVLAMTMATMLMVWRRLLPCSKRRNLPNLESEGACPPMDSGRHSLPLRLGRLDTTSYAMSDAS